MKNYGLNCTCGLILTTKIILRFAALHCTISLVGIEDTCDQIVLYNITLCIICFVLYNVGYITNDSFFFQQL